MCNPFFKNIIKHLLDNPIKEIMGISYAFLQNVCCSCTKKRAERREILLEFFETEKKYARDLQIIIDEFYQPMIVAGLLTKDQLASIFLNIEELLENSLSFCAKIIDNFSTASDQVDDDLLTVDIGKIILEESPMLCAFETYCVQQGDASLLLANVEKDKELLRIFLRVSQMENSVLRRMNLNSFLMVIINDIFVGKYVVCVKLSDFSMCNGMRYIRFLHASIQSSYSAGRFRAKRPSGRPNGSTRPDDGTARPVRVGSDCSSGLGYPNDIRLFE